MFEKCIFMPSICSSKPLFNYCLHTAHTANSVKRNSFKNKKNIYFVNPNTKCRQCMHTEQRVSPCMHTLHILFIAIWNQQNHNIGCWIFCRAVNLFAKHNIECNFVRIDFTCSQTYTEPQAWQGGKLWSGKECTFSN